MPLRGKLNGTVLREARYLGPVYGLLQYTKKTGGKMVARYSVLHVNLVPGLSSERCITTNKLCVTTTKLCITTNKFCVIMTRVVLYHARINVKSCKISLIYKRHLIRVNKD